VNLTIKIRKALGVTPFVLDKVDTRRPGEIEQDTRILYGASCTWWDHLATTNLLRGAAFQCPKCGGDLLFMHPAKWWRGIIKYADKHKDPGYLDFMKWLRGQCYRSPVFARTVWEEEKLVQGRY